MNDSFYECNDLVDGEWCLGPHHGDFVSFDGLFVPAFFTDVYFYLEFL